jgi:hypothetical protein
LQNRRPTACYDSQDKDERKQSAHGKMVAQQDREYLPKLQPFT